MPELTFIIPIGLHHQDLARRAIESAEQQTMPCEVLTLVDERRQGPGALRNRLLMQATTPFVAFLDADDWVEPTFAEEALAEYRRIGGSHYIFTDWINGRGEMIAAPCQNGPDGAPLSMPERKPYCGGTWHAITALLPIAWARAVNGFDEQLPAVEDTDFYLKLCTTFRCGHRLARPLFHYSPAGGRGATFRDGPDYHKVMGELTLRYGGKMGCCGDKTAIAKPIGDRQSGDVLAMALWHGNRTEFGRVTKRNYPRLSYPRTAWIDPRDVAQSPALWQAIEQPVAAPAPVDQGPGLTSVAEIARMGMATVVKQPYAPPAFEPPPPPVEAKPDVNRVMRLARRATEKIDEPIFIFPEKDYPSYSDIRRLVALSGFDAITTKQIDVFSRRPYIVVSPEPIPNLNGIPARVICWQLEYAGDYVNNYKDFKGAVWASDKAWADAHGAKYVLLGSHPELADEHPAEADWLYDVTMLGYMTPRRQAIKALLSDLRWPVDYPGHDTPARNEILWDTRLMLHVHQHDNARYLAPQRIAVAAAYHMPVISEVTYEIEESDRTELPILMTGTDKIPESVRGVLLSPTTVGEDLHQFLCVEHTFRQGIEEALKS